MSNRNANKSKWISTLKKALDHDQWGQSLEATEGYQTLIKMMSPSSADELKLSVDERSIIEKSKAVVRRRLQAITSLEGNSTTIQDVKKIETALSSLFSGKEINMDIKVELGPSNAPRELKSDIGNTGDDVGHSLLPPPKNMTPGCKTISIKIHSVGLKDAPTYIDPFVTVSVVNGVGQILGEPQDTKKSHLVKDKQVIFEQTVHIQRPLDNFSEEHSIFFEFKHWKPKKKKFSTRCYTFMEYDEIVTAKTNTSVQLELYKKPTNFRKRNIKLFSVKQLYFSVTVVTLKH